MTPEDIQPQPTVIGRIGTAVVFVIVGVAVYAVREFLIGMAAFTRKTGDDGSISTALFFLLTMGSALITLIAPRPKFVMIAGVCMIPYVLLSAYLLLMPPIGIALLLPPFVWYRVVMRPILDQPLYP